MQTMLIGRRDYQGVPHTDVQAFDVIVTQEDLDFVHEAVHQGNRDNALLLLAHKGNEVDAVVDFAAAHPLGVTLAPPPPRAVHGTLPPPVA